MTGKRFLLWRRHALIAVLAFIFALHIPWLAKPPSEYDAWRQSDTEAIALNIVESGFSCLYPQLNYDGPPPNIVQLEPSLTPLLIALLYEAFGRQYALARLVPLVFFLGSAAYVYRIGRQFFPSAVSVAAALVYGLLPLNLLYGRAIMPEAGALFFTTGAFYYFTAWMRMQEQESGDSCESASGGTSRTRPAPLLMAAAFTALAVSQKIPAIFVGVPMLAMALVRWRLAVWRRPQLWGFALAALLPPYLYYRHLSAVAEFRFVDGIAAKHVLPRMWTDFRSGEALRFFCEEMPRAFTWWGLALFAAGLAALRWKNDYPLAVWTLSIAAEFALIVAVIRFPYYMIFLGPPLSLLAGRALSLLWPSRAGIALSALLMLALAGQSLAVVLPQWRMRMPELERQAAIVREIAEPDDLIVVGMDDPSLLNAARRKGWRVGSVLPGDPLAELDYFVRNGAAYFVPLQGTIRGDDGRLAAFLEKRYRRIEPVPGYPVYRLQ